MKRCNTVIIGAGQCGLAMSHELSQSGVDHVILERGQVANSWKTERWDSLKLLSPNWMNGLAGQPYAGDDPDGFMGVSELITSLETASSDAPVQSETRVLSVNQTESGFRVQSDQGAFDCRNVVMANGACAVPKVPAFAEALPADIQQFTPLTYKRPEQLPEGKVLVVGASASGLQLAREIQGAGRPVTLAVGTHLRFPRRYRGQDVATWLEATGVTSISHTEVDDLERVRRTPSLTLVADETIDLNTLQDTGVEIVGRLAAYNDGKAVFSGSLANLCAAADLKMNRLLASIDEWIAENALTTLMPQAERFAPTRIPEAPRLGLDLKREGFTSVVWATGYSPDFSWLNLPVFDRKGRLQHDGGLVAPGLYALGLPYLRQRKSTFIAGASEDARALANHLTASMGHALAA